MASCDGRTRKPGIQKVTPNGGRASDTLETQPREKHKMNTYRISRNDDKPIKTRKTTDLSACDVAEFLSSVDACLYSIGEYGEDDDCVERLNGEEWIDANVCARCGGITEQGRCECSPGGTI